MRSTIAAPMLAGRRVILEARIAELRHPGVAVVLRVVHAARRRRIPTRRSGCRGGCRSRRSPNRRPDRPSPVPRCRPPRFARRHSAYTLPLPSGSGTARATSRSAPRSDGDPPPLKRAPCAATSWLKYATASRLRAQRIVLDVLRRAEQPPLLRVPRREDDRALRADARLQLLGHGVRRLEHADRAAHVVGGARTPRVAVAANDHDLVGKLAAAHDAESVVDRLERFRRAVVVNRDARAHRAGADVIVERKPALPAARNRRAL